MMRRLPKRCRQVKDFSVHPAIVVHNAVGAERGTYAEIDPQNMRRAFEINTMAALLSLAKQLIPDMQASGGGALICTGNTSAYRGKPRLPDSPPPRPHSEYFWRASPARQVPKGIHAAYVAIDAD